mmetsp:Transcript_6343/g.13855  ORF Transcript_6343/g.13855 Transcript_6343/m.13855 type:complete len:533 (+) Transcript_6343:77-1675(+)
MPGWTKMFIEDRVRRTREKDAKTDEIRKMLFEHNMFAGHTHSDVRVDCWRRAHTDARERRELATDYAHMESLYEKDRRERVAEAEDRLADELARRKAERTREEAHKRRVCEDSEELRVLKEKIHAAKVSQERAQQLLDKHMRTQRANMYDHKLAEVMETRRAEEMEEVYKKQVEQNQQREKVKQINQQQIALREARKSEALANYEKERDDVQQLVARLAHEDALDAAARAQKAKDTKESMLQCAREQAERKAAMAEQERQENDRMAQFLRDKIAREDAEAERKVQEAKEREHVVRNILGQMEAKSKEKEELEQLRNDLHTEEVEAAHRRREQAQKDRRARDREDMKQAYQRQMQEREEKQAAELEEENRIREQLLQKFAEDEKLEQMNDQKRRMRMAEHVREANRHIEMRRQIYEEERKNQQGDVHRGAAEEADRKAIVEAERRRLLKENAKLLQNFMPKGALDKPEDYDIVFGRGATESNSGEVADTTRPLPPKAAAGQAIIQSARGPRRPSNPTTMLSARGAAPSSSITA